METNREQGKLQALPPIHVQSENKNRIFGAFKSLTQITVTCKEIVVES